MCTVLATGLEINAPQRAIAIKTKNKFNAYGVDTHSHDTVPGNLPDRL